MATNLNTIAKSGGDYTTIAAWESDTDNDLVSAGDIEVGELEDDGTDWTQSTVTIAGATTDASNYRQLTAKLGHRHDGTVHNGGVQIAPGSNGHAFVISEDNFHVEGLMITSLGGVSDEAFRLDDADGFTADKLIIYDSSTNNVDGIYCGNFGSTDTHTYFIRNCIFYNLGRTAIHIQNSDNKTVFVHNCTAIDMNIENNSNYCAIGFDNSSSSDNSTMHCTNCFAEGNHRQFGTDGAGSGDINVENCGVIESDIATDGATEVGSGNVEDVVLADAFEDPTTTIDLHLKSGSDLIDAGVDLSSDSDLPVTDDIDYVTRTGTFDIGADQFVPAGAVRTLFSGLIPQPMF